MDAKSSSLVDIDTAPLVGQCGICFDDAPLLTWAALATGCGHAYCLPCTTRHVLGELDIPGADRLRCPYRGEPAECTAPPGPQTLEAVIATGSLGPLASVRARERAAAARRADALAATRQRLAQNGGSSAALCPNPACAHVFVVPAALGVGSGWVQPCPSCDALVCGRCAVPWGGDPSRQQPPHDSLSCAAVAEAISVGEALAAAAREAEASAASASAAAAAFGPLAASVKRCPGCGTGVSHYRGHACHHISPGRGCPECVRSGRNPAAHWCYCCRGPWPCASGCPSFCDPACDCADCPDCAAGAPCEHCSGPAGGCRVCSGTAGDPARDAAWAAVQRSARAARAVRGWIGPSSLRQAPPSSAPAAVAVEPSAADLAALAEMRAWVAQLEVFRGCALAGQQSAEVRQLIRALERPAGAAAAAAALEAWGLLRTQLVALWREGPLRTLFVAGGFRLAAALGQCTTPRDAVALVHAVSREVAASASVSRSDRNVRYALLSRGGVKAIVEYVLRMLGGGSADGSEALPALSEGVLELFELLCASPSDVAALASQGGFGVVYRMLARHSGTGGSSSSTSVGGSSSPRGMVGRGALPAPNDAAALPMQPRAPSQALRVHVGVLHRALRVLEVAGRVATAAGRDVPPEAEAAFDRAGGTTLLARLVATSAARRDAVLLTLSLRALAAVRLHSPSRVSAARPLLGLLVRLLVGAPLPAPPRAAVTRVDPAAGDLRTPHPSSAQLEDPVPPEAVAAIPRFAAPPAAGDVGSGESSGSSSRRAMLLSSSGRRITLAPIALTTTGNRDPAVFSAPSAAASLDAPPCASPSGEPGEEPQPQCVIDVRALPAPGGPPSSADPSPQLLVAQSAEEVVTLVVPMPAATAVVSPRVPRAGAALLPPLAESSAPAQLSTQAAAAAVVVLARLVTALRGGVQGGPLWGDADTAAVAAASAAAPPTRGGVAPDRWGLGAAMLALAETRRDDRLPLWEGVVLAGALLALRQATSPVASVLTPWRVSPPLRDVAWHHLPSPPYALAELARIMRFRPGTLRARLAAGAELTAQVADLDAAIAVPLWQLILVVSRGGRSLGAPPCPSPDVPRASASSRLPSHSSLACGTCCGGSLRPAFAISRGVCSSSLVLPLRLSPCSPRPLPAASCGQSSTTPLWLLLCGCGAG